MHKLILSLLLCSPMVAMQEASLTRIVSNSVLSRNTQNSVSLYHDGESFHVEEAGKFVQIPSYDTEQPLRKINATQLTALLANGHLSVNKLSDGSYTVKSHIHGLGGGVISGAIAYWVTKTLCYGTAVAAAGGAVVVTGGTAGALGGALAASATVGASTAATVVGGAVAGAGLTAQAATVTAATITSAGSIAGAVAAVESASTAAGAFFLAIPFLS